MLVLVLMVTALFVSDVAGKTICLEVQQPLCKPQDCDEGWLYFPSLNSCYRNINIKKTWQEAEEFCNQLPHYGNLASVTSPKHNTFISSIILAMDASKPWTWIGLNDIWKEGTFTWSDGSSYNYQNWSQGEPNDRNNEDCVHILYGSTGYGCWNDLPCDKKLGFVCAYKLLNV
ncbi:C-type lectin mannose-binding isoform-like [Hemitrygon akajei]|uniref:C-type lectin mannose-binding isoform-like n=1 Tax=Hemitrygon akajei TaxID=2704970 RepID=UPI003BF94BE4